MSDHKTVLIHEYWILSMVLFGFIGIVIISLIILYSAYNTYTNIVIKKRNVIATLVLLNFSLWSSNVTACVIFAVFRTNLFITLNATKCTIIYITNYFFYMFGKYCLHILLLYRLYIGFQGTKFEIKSRTMKFIGSLMTANFLGCTALWVRTCTLNVIVGATVPRQAPHLHICTLYNNDVHQAMPFHHKLWPILLGAQDMIISTTTIGIFASHMRKLAGHSTSSGRNIYAMDMEFEMVIRKLIVLGLIAIFSTSIFYTFAVPFYPNLTFLLPIDCAVNSLCTLLLLEYGKDIYKYLCCVPDKILLMSLGHKVPIIENLAISTGIDIKLDLKLDMQVHTNSPKTTPMTSPISSKRRSTILKFEASALRMTSFTMQAQPSMSMGNLKNVTNTNLKPLPLSQSRFVHSAFL